MDKNDVYVGMKASIRTGSDVRAFTVIRVTEGRGKIILQRCTVKALHQGFTEDQKWDIKDDPNGEIVDAHWSAKANRFKSPFGWVTLGVWREFYDYSF